MVTVSMLATIPSSVAYVSDGRHWRAEAMNLNDIAYEPKFYHNV